ncbi:MAG TPA: glycosyltransferase family 10 [Gemmatimonadaceae bacterium]
MSTDPTIPAGAGDVSVYFAPPNHQLYGGRLFELEGNQFAGDNILAPFAAVHAHLSAAGCVVDTIDRLPQRPDGRRNVVISYGMPEPHPSDAVRRYTTLAKRDDVTLAAFFALECPIVEPGLYRELPAMHGFFDRVYSWSDTTSLLQFTGRPVSAEHFCWPQSFDAVHEPLWQARDRRFIVMMNANKLPRLDTNELYSARRRAVEYFHRFGEVDLYGRHWDQAPRRVGKSRTPATIRRLLERAWQMRQRLLPDPVYAAASAAWRGAAPSKSQTMSQYRFALCFENSVLKGWMTEKLFDCFFVGTIPIYWGAPDVLEWVPAECFIDMRQFRDLAELRAFLHALTPAEEQRYRDAARAFLESERFDPFRIRAWVELHDRIVRDAIGASA